MSGSIDKRELRSSDRTTYNQLMSQKIWTLVIVLGLIGLFGWTYQQMEKQKNSPGQGWQGPTLRQKLRDVDTHSRYMRWVQERRNK
jgi:hypothetical protein